MLALPSTRFVRAAKSELWRYEVTEIERVRQVLSEALGVDPEEIKPTNPRWLQLLQEGVIVRLHIGRWRAKTSLHWQDLGLRPTSKEEREALAELIEPGFKRLLPKEVMKRLDAIEAKGRAALEKHAFKTYWGFFVPVTAWAEWRERDREIREEYLEVCRNLADSWDEMVEQVLDGYRVTARSAYRRLRLLNPEAVKGLTEDEFTDRFIRAVRAHIPSVERFRRSFYYETEMEYVPLPSLLAEEQAEAERIKAEHHLEMERLRAEEIAVRTAADERLRMLREMNREVVEQARRKKKQLVDRFLRDVTAQLRSLVYDVCTNVLATMERNGGRLHPRSVIQLRNLVEQLERLNFTGDREVEEIIKEVRYHLGQPAESRSPAEIENALRDIAIVARAALIGLGEQPRSARSLGIPDEPPEPLVREIRRRRFEVEEMPELPGLDLDAIPRRPRRVTAEALQAVPAAL